MKFMNLTTTFLFVATFLALATAEDFNYASQGSDWPELCRTGKAQSPIDIPTSKHSLSPNTEGLKFQKFVIFPKYHEEETHVDQSLKMVKFEANKGNLHFLKKCDKEFEILQFHFHAPSEHTFNGKHYDLELHIVHKDAKTGKFAVIGIFFDQSIGDGDQTNDFIESLKLGQKDSPPNVKLQLQDIIRPLKLERSYSYKGGLTTPPCAEVVTFLLINDPQPITAEQLKVFNERWHYNGKYNSGTGNNRVVQPLNGRTIYKNQFNLYNQCFSDFDACKAMFLS